MATFRMMQGDSYPVFVKLKQNGIVLTANMVEDVEICVGESLRKTLSSGEVSFDESQQMWYFTPTQQETLDLNPDSYSVIARVKYKNRNRQDVKGVVCGNIMIQDTHSEEVL